MSLKRRSVYWRRHKSPRAGYCKDQFFVVLESIKPVNIIKSTFNEVVSSPNLMNNVLGASIGLAAGYLSNKTVVGSSGNVFKKFLGTILQFGVTTLIMKNPEAIKSLGESLLERFLTKKVDDS